MNPKLSNALKTAQDAAHQALARLERQADRTGDGRFTRADVEILKGAMQTHAEEATRAQPIRALVVAAVAAAAVASPVAFALGRVLKSCTIG
jgi:hypothetical protein